MALDRAGFSATLVGQGSHHTSGDGDMGFYWSVKSAAKVVAAVFVVGFLTGFVGAQYSVGEPAGEIAVVEQRHDPRLLGAGR